MNGPTAPFDIADRKPRGGKRGRILTILREQFQQVPSTEIVVYAKTREEIDIQVAATFDLSIFVDGLVDCEGATMYANWWPQRDVEGQFKFHYTDTSGFDCGWHRHDNDHDFEGLDHYQERADSDDEYRYEPVEFGQTNPTGLVWEIAADRLERRVRHHHDPNSRLTDFIN